MHQPFEPNLIKVLLKYSVLTSQTPHHVSITKFGGLMLFILKIVQNIEMHCGQNA